MQLLAVHSSWEYNVILHVSDTVVLLKQKANKLLIFSGLAGDFKLGCCVT